MRQPGFIKVVLLLHSLMVLSDMTFCMCVVRVCSVLFFWFLFLSLFCVCCFVFLVFVFFLCFYTSCCIQVNEKSCRFRMGAYRDGVKRKRDKIGMGLK